MVQIVLQERRVVTTKKENHLPFWGNFSAHHNQAHMNLNQRNQKFFHLWQNRVDTPLVDTVNQNFIYIPILYTFSLNYSIKIFSVSNDGIK